MLDKYERIGLKKKHADLVGILLTINLIFQRKPLLLFTIIFK
jgi:hypothetical protein